ncbi:hypothetical protein [Marinobacter salarius]|uniref:hypothetical protein n=1 Tax=Marinobacter salarius TaxID=1420917 RepID=UPI003BAA2C62
MSERQDFLNWKINKGMYGWSHECAKLVDEAYERGKAAREKEGGEAVGWGPKPNKPGRYAVRGFDSSGTEALVCVAYDDDQLVCNLHDSNSDPLRKFSNLMSEISNKFEWAELYSAPLTEDADDLPIVWINPENIRRTMIASPGETVEVSAYREGEFTAPLYTHPPQAQGVPEGWIINRESEDRITLDADGIGFCVARVNAERIADIMLYALANDLLLSTPAAPQADEIEPDLLWDYDNGEDSGQDSAYELADYCAQDLPHGETMEVVVMCAKRLPNRHMKIWVDEDDDVQWEWISPQPPEQGDGV